MKTDRAGSLITAALGAFLIWQGSLLPKGDSGSPGSGFFPKVIGVGLIALSVILFIWPSHKTTVKDLLPSNLQTKQVAWFIFVLIVYTLLLKPLGFIIATFLLITVLMQSYHRSKNWPITVLFALALTLASYWLFAKIFAVSLPEGLFAF